MHRNYRFACYLESFSFEQVDMVIFFHSWLQFMNQQQSAFLFFDKVNCVDNES